MHATLDKPGIHPLLQPSAAKLLTVGAAGTTLLFALSTEDGPVLCPFRRCTGGYCPGCGLTRSGGRFLRGDVVGSWQHHPYLIIGLIQAVLGAAVWQLGSPALRQWIRSRTSAILTVNLAVMLTVWIIRMVDGSIPVPFVG